MKLTPKILLRIDSSKWIQDELIGFELGLHKCTKPYQIFEKVFLNVASENSKTWKDIYNANPRNTDNFSQLCIAAILIDKWLGKVLNYQEAERLKLLERRLASIVYQYRQYSMDND